MIDELELKQKLQGYSDEAYHRVCKLNVLEGLIWNYANKNLSEKDLQLIIDITAPIAAETMKYLQRAEKELRWFRAMERAQNNDTSSP